MQDESNFHENFGYTLRCATGGKVRETPAFSGWMRLTMLVMMAIVPIYVHFNYVNYKTPETADCMCRVRNNYFISTRKYFIFT